MNKPSVSTWSESPSETVFSGITRQVVHGELQTLVRYVYQPGSSFPVHHHPEEQVTVVISGRIEFDIDGTRMILGPGQVAVIPAGTPHGATVIGDQSVETFNSLSPKRKLNPFDQTTGGSSGE